MSINEIPKPEIDVGDKNETVHYFHHHESGVNRVFIDNPMFLQKVWGMAGGKIYDSVASTDNHDTQLCSVRNFVSIYYLHGSDKNGCGKNVDLWSLIGKANVVAECDHRFFMDLMVKITTLERTVLLVVWIVWKSKNFESFVWDEWSRKGCCTYPELS